MKYLKLIPVLLLLIFAQSCETEVDLFSEQEDVAVIFALLDQSASVQYFRINPTFIGEGDARDLASDPSLTSYGDGVLDVRLYDLTLGSTDNPIFYQAEETTDIELDGDGIFDPHNRLYKINTPVTIDSKGKIDNSILIAGNTFQLWVRNTVSGKLYTSELELGDINDMLMLSPVDGDRKQSYTHMKFFTGEQYQRFTFQFGRVDGADRYKLEMRYYYTEGTDSVPDSSTQFINYVIGEENNINRSSSSISMDFDGEKFYQVMNSILDEDVNNSRTGRKIDLIVTAAGDDLDTYIEVQDASQSGLSQERPSYSNIENGLGIFSFRSTRVFPGFFLNQPSGKWVPDGGNAYTGDRFKCATYGTISNYQGIIHCP